MAVERIRSFSIREFAAKSRSVDLERCWPLGRVGKREERCLPPMTWRKFRWWSAELDTVRSADLAGKDEKGVGEEGADGLGKVSRTPKKRSIVEIFAVAPQIDGGEHLEEDKEGGDLDGSNLELVKRRKEESVEILMNKKQKKKSAEMNNNNKKKKKNKNLGKIYNHKMSTSKFKNKKQKSTTTTRTKHLTESKGGISDKFQGKSSKISTSPNDISKSKLCSLLGRCDNETTIQDFKRKHRALKNSNKQKKQKTVGNGKLPLQKKNGKSPEGYIHGILKGQEKIASTHNATASNDLKGRGVMSLRHVRQSDKRVRFLGNDNILSPQSKSCSLVELLNLQDRNKGFSKSQAISSDICAANSTQSPDAAGGRVDVEDELHICPASVCDKENIAYDDGELCGAERHLDINVTEPTNQENCLEVNKLVTCHSVDLNYPLTDSGDLDMLVPCTSPAPSNPIGSGCSVQISKQVPLVNHVEGISSTKRQTSGRPPLHSGYICRSSGISSTSYLTKAHSRESSHLLRTANEHDDGQSFNLLASSSNNFNHFSDVLPFHNASRSNLWNNNHYFSLEPERPFSEKDRECGGHFIRSNATEIYQHRYVNGDFIGLPLNSQGELMQLQSQGNLGPTNLSEASSVGFSRDCSTQKSINALQNWDHQSKDKYLDTRVCTNERDFITKQPLFQDQPTYRHSTTANIFPEPPVLGMSSQYQDPGRSVDRHAYQFLLEHRPSSFHGFRRHNEGKRRTEIEIAYMNNTWDIASQPSNQSTMRLMGKNLTVGKSSQECQGFEDGKVWTDKEIIAEQSTVLQDPGISALKWHPRQENFFTRGRLDSNLTHPMDSYMCDHSDSGYYQEGNVYRGFRHNHRDCITRSGPLIVGKHSSRLDPFYKSETGELLTCMQNQPETVAGNQSAIMFSQLPLKSSCRYDDCCKIHSSRLHSTVSPAFWNMERGNHIRHEFPAQNLQQWLMDTTKYKKVQNTAICPRTFPDRHPQAVFDVNFHPYSSLYPRSEIPFPPTAQGSFNRSSLDLPLNPFTKHSPMVTSSSRADGDRQDSWIQRDDLSYRNDVYFDEHDHNKMVKKMPPPAKPNDMMKAAKKQNLAILDDIDIREGSKKTDSPRGLKTSAAVAPEFCANEERGIAQEINEMFCHPNASKSSTSNLGSGSGPVKLSAGVKHILKPCENLNIDKSRPIHSTIPFPSRSETWKAPTTQKAAKVYEF